MQKETWHDFRTVTYLAKFYPEKELVCRHLIALQWKAVRFIEKLLQARVPLWRLDINDWNSNSSPGVYVIGRKYSRFARNDWKKALTYYRKII